MRTFGDSVIVFGLLLSLLGSICPFKAIQIIRILFFLLPHVFVLLVISLPKLFLKRLYNLIFLLLIIVVFVILRGLFNQRVVSVVKVLWLPILSHKTSCLFEIRCEVLMFFFPLNFYFHPGPCVTPLFNCLFQLFIPPLISQFLILVMIPHFFQLLLSFIDWRIVVNVVRSSLKPILSFEHHWFSRSVELLEWMRINWLLLVFLNRVSLSCQVSLSSRRSDST